MLGDEGGELGRVGDNREAPDEPDRQHDPCGRVQEKADEERARSRDGHGQRGRLRPSDPIAEESADPAADRADADDREGRVGGAAPSSTAAE